MKEQWQNGKDTKEERGSDGFEGQCDAMANCAGEHTLHGLSARRASYMELVLYF